MRKISTLLLALGIASASLSSCSRSNYAFNPATPAYLGSEPAKVATRKAPEAAPAAKAVATAPATVAAPKTVVPAPAAEVAVAPAKAPVATAAPAQVAPGTLAATEAAPAKAVKPTLMQRLALNKLTKQLAKIQQKQATVNTEKTESMVRTGIYLGIAGLLAIIIGLVLIGGSGLSGSGGGVVAGAILYFLGYIALVVGIILLIIGLVRGK